MKFGSYKTKKKSSNKIQRLKKNTEGRNLFE